MNKSCPWPWINGKIVATGNFIFSRTRPENFLDSIALRHRFRAANKLINNLISIDEARWSVTTSPECFEEMSPFRCLLCLVLAGLWCRRRIYLRKVTKNVDRMLINCQIISAIASGGILFDVFLFWWLSSSPNDLSCFRCRLQSLVA